jgi:membrane protease YdiL (CAAX protease family)
MEQIRLSRAALFKGLIGISGVFILDKVSKKTTDFPVETLAEPISPEKDPSYSETTIEQGLMILAKLLVSKVFEQLKIAHGNKSLKSEELIQFLQEKPLEGLIELGFIGPAMEETIFRLLPSVLIGKQGQRCDVGIPTSALFALIHNIEGDQLNTLKLAKSIPIAQFLGGLFYWYLMREKGFSHAVLGHTINNSAYFIGQLLLRAYPKTT